MKPTHYPLRFIGIPWREKAAASSAFLIAGLLLVLVPLRAEVLTLDKALEIAFKNSPSIQEAVFQLDISERNLLVEQAGLKSQFNLSITPITLSESRVFNELTGSYSSQEIKRSEARFSITQPIKWTDGTITLIDRFNWQEASSSFTGNVKDSNFNNSLTLRFNQPLFTYNRTKLRINELELSLENAQLNYAIQKLQIERQVTQQFLDLYSSRERVIK